MTIDTGFPRIPTIYKLRKDGGRLFEMGAGRHYGLRDRRLFEEIRVGVSSRRLMVALGARVLISEPLYDRPCLEEGKNCKTRSPMYPFITLSMYSSILSANLFFHLCSPQKVTRRLQMRRDTSSTSLFI